MYPFVAALRGLIWLGAMLMLTVGTLELGIGRLYTRWQFEEITLSLPADADRAALQRLSREPGITPFVSLEARLKDGRTVPAGDQYLR